MKKHQLNEIPELTTKRLILRELIPENAQKYFEICSEAETMANFGVLAHENLQKTRLVIEFLRKDFLQKASIRWGIFDRDNNTLIGDIGFWRFDWQRERAEIGGKISPSAQKKGFMFEAMRKVIDFGFRDLNLNSIEGGVSPENLGSIALVKKLGFKQEGYREKFSFSPYKSCYVDSILFSLVKDWWCNE